METIGKATELRDCQKTERLEAHHEGHTAQRLAIDSLVQLKGWSRSNKISYCPKAP